jgi:hypothetical protein
MASGTTEQNYYAGEFDQLGTTEVAASGGAKP